MNLQIINFYDPNTEINVNSFCLQRGGKNIPPTILWNDVPYSKSYALIMEDPNSINGHMIHWFIPTIYDNVVINSLNYK